MVNKYISGIAFVLMMMSVAVLIAMAAAPTVTITTPASNDSLPINGSFTFIATVTNTDNENTNSVYFNFTNGSWVYSSGNLSSSTSTFSFPLDTQGMELEDGNYSLEVTATNDGLTLPNSSTANRTFIIDNTPPPAVTIENVDKGQTYINWSWTAPSTTDFSGVYLSIEGGSASFISHDPGSISSYNATKLSSNTTYSISLRSVDTTGNVNASVTNETTTLPNTVSDGPISLGSNVVANFSGISSPGNTSMTISNSNTFGVSHASIFNAVGSYYDITTTANFAGGYLIVEIPYTPGSFDENLVRLYHLESGVWKDVTSGKDPGANKVFGNVTTLSPFVPGVLPGPGIVSTSPSSPHETTGSTPANFTATFNQTVNVSWYINSTPVSVPLNTSVTSSYYLNSAPTRGTWNITVVGNNTNGSVSYTWIWNVRSKTFQTGNRVWDATKGMSTTYTWNPYSFSGFYYNLDSDLGTENLQIKNIDNRNLGEGDITYITSPQEVNFTYSRFGSYQVIGFMAEKYFAGYTPKTNPPGQTSTISAVSTLSAGQLHKVLLDDKDKRTISEGGTFTLKEGYVLQIKAVDIGAGPGQIWYILLKDGSEVDQGTLAGDETYVYQASRVGGVTDLPIIIVHFTNVFRGREINAAFIEGVFQISDSPTYVKSGDRKGVMEVTGVDANQITMKNKNTIDLSPGTTRDLMGNLKIMVADSSTLRFGLTTEISGNYEVRGTIYNATDEWTPMNFGFNTGGTNIGFYYDIDGDVGNETLRIVDDLTGKRQIAENGLEYSTTPQEVGFEYSKFGSYQVIGFKAEKYFAGYTSNSTPTEATSSVGQVSTLSSGQLHKVLLDDRDKRTISEGGTITLKEGYVLQIKAVDIGAGPGQIWYVLLKDGSEIDQGTLAGGQTYVYQASRVGGVSDLPILFVHFTSVFRGREINAAFIEGVFQISDSPTYVKSGDRVGVMEVTGVNENQITMKNKGTISLASSTTSDVMGNIKFKVADSNTLRFYPFVTVTEAMIANQLVIDAPAKASAGDVINIKVTAGGNIAGNVSISIDSTDAGQTDNNGYLNYTLPKTLKGNYNITATKLGYQKAVRSIEILQYVEYRLSMEVPAKANQFETLRIRITYNGSAISGATVTYDNATIGTTDSNGTLNYKLETSGTHTISASKTGYITVSRELEVRAPYTEYKALDINVTPEVIFSGQKYMVRSNVTNVGTKADTLPVVLIVNGSVESSTNVTIDPGKTQEVNFTQEMTLPMGNYSVEILDQKKVVEVKEEPLNYLLIGGIATGLGAVIIYILTAKNKISLDAIKSSLNVEAMRSKLNVEAIKKLLEKSGKKGI